MVAKAEPAGIEVDLTKVTAREMSAFFKAASGNDMEALATFFTKVVVSCPYGPASAVDTYLDLPFFGDFQDVLEAVVEASKNARPR